MNRFDAKLEIVVFGNQDVIATSCPTECIEDCFSDYFCPCDGSCLYDICTCDGRCETDICDLDCEVHCEVDFMP